MEISGFQQPRVAGGPIEILTDITGPIQQWLKRIQSDDPVAIVTVSRKGTRLIEVLSQFILPEPLPKEIITTDLALAFEPLVMWRNKRVAVVDDIVAWGTAMRNQREQFKRHGIDPSLFCIALDKNHAGWVYPDHILDTEEHETSAFCSAIVRAIGLLNKPYDLEHPIIYHPFHFTKSDFSFKSLPEGTRLYRLTLPSQEEYGLLRASIDLLPAFGIEDIFDPKLKPTLSPLRKIRFYGSIEESLMALTPMLIFQWPNNLLSLCKKGEIFIPELHFLNEIISRAFDIVTANSNWSPDIASISLTRLCAYLTNYIAYLRFSSTLLDELTCGFQLAEQQGKPSLWDLQLIFGRPLAVQILHCFEVHKHQLTEVSKRIHRRESHQFLQQSLFDMPSYTTGNSNDALEIGMEEKWDQFEKQVKEQIAPHAAPERCILEVFKVMQEIYDHSTRDPNVYNPERIHLGLTFIGIETLLKRAGKSIEPFQLSACIDFLVDAGAVVPRYMVDSSGAIRRIFRFGEDLFSLSKAPYTLREILRFCLDKQIFGHSLAHFYFEKTVAFLVCTLEKRWRENDTFVGLYWDQFGVRTEFDKPGKKRNLEKYCLTEKIAKIKEVKNKDGIIQKRCFELEPQFRSLHSPAKCPLSEDREISELHLQLLLFQTLIKNSGAISDDYILALTTCFDSDSTTRALRAEIDGWLTHFVIGVQNIVAAFSSHLDQRTNLKQLIISNASFAKQMVQKYNVFFGLPEILKLLDKKLEGNTKEAITDRSLWKQRRGYISIAVSKVANRKLQALQGIASLLTYTTSILSRIFNESTRDPISFSYELGKKTATLSNNYNNPFEAHKKMNIEQLLSGFNQKLLSLQRDQPHLFSAVSNFPATIGNQNLPLVERERILSEALCILRDDLKCLVDKLDLVEIPDSIGLGTTYLVAYDSVDSSSVPHQKRSDIFRGINKKLKRYLDKLSQGSVIGFPNEPNDGQHIVLRNIEDAWSVANFIYEIEGAIAVKARVALFESEGINELFLDPFSQKADGDSHAYVQRMLAFSDAVDNKAIIMTVSVFNALCDKNMIDKDNSKFEPLEKSKIKGERLKELDIIRFFLPQSN